jgi:hypothetical protein
MAVLRHVLLMNWAHPLSAAELADVQAAIDQLAEEAESVRALSHGADAGLRDGRYDYALVVDFDDGDGWAAYSAHPVHEKLRQLLEPIKKDTCVTQFYVEDAHNHPKRS